MMGVLGHMIEFFLLMSIFAGFFSYIMIDPLKSCFFMIMSILLLIPLFSFMNYIWFSYFISLLFLSGIFVIMVYFSSMSTISKDTSFMSIIMMFLLLLFSNTDFGYFDVNLNLWIFYKMDFIYILVYLIFSLMMLLIFASYYINMSGALRMV